MIDNRKHSVVVYDDADHEIFSIGQPYNSRDAVIDVHNVCSYAYYTRNELREIAEAIVIFTNTVVVKPESQS